MKQRKKLPRWKHKFCINFVYFCKLCHYWEWFHRWHDLAIVSITTLWFIITSQKITSSIIILLIVRLPIQKLPICRGYTKENYGFRDLRLRLYQCVLTGLSLKITNIPAEESRYKNYSVNQLIYLSWTIHMKWNWQSGVQYQINLRQEHF